MTLNEAIKTEALEHAREEIPKESVGLVCIVKGREKYFRCNNQAEKPNEHFILDPDDYISVENKGEITAIIHSHPRTLHHPSQADLVGCERSGVPWYIVQPKTEMWGYCEPNGYELPYVGRPFAYGLIDCYSLVRDYYQREFGISLTDYHRKEQWWYKGENLYKDLFPKEGFHVVQVAEAKKGDLFLMQLDANVCNHAAIYLGGQRVLHHVQGRLSSNDLYGSYYQKMTDICIRHESR